MPELALMRVVSRIIADNPDKVEQAKAKPAIIGWFIGQVMAAMGGDATALDVRVALERRGLIATPPPDPERRKMDDPADCECDWCRIGRLNAELDRLRAENARLKGMYQASDAENDELRADIHRLTSPLFKLANEVSGILGGNEPGLRELFGNTNVAVLKERLAEARAALAADPPTKATT